MEKALNIRNPEHYMDVTPHDAINGMQPKSGEIWTYGQVDDECLILKNQGTFCNALKLMSTERGHCIPVGEKWVNPAMVMYVFNDGIHDFARKLSATDFADVLNNVEAALDIAVACTPPTFYESDLCEAKMKATHAEVANNELRLENARLHMQFDVMKSMYYELLDRMLAR